MAGDWLEAQKLDIRVGKVISAELHPDADRLVTDFVKQAVPQFLAETSIGCCQSVCGASRCRGGGTPNHHQRPSQICAN